MTDSTAHTVKKAATTIITALTAGWPLISVRAEIQPLQTNKTAGVLQQKSFNNRPVKKMMSNMKINEAEKRR